MTGMKKPFRNELNSSVDRNTKYVKLKPVLMVV